MWLLLGFVLLDQSYFSAHHTKIITGFAWWLEIFTLYSTTYTLSWIVNCIFTYYTALKMRLPPKFYLLFYKSLWFICIGSWVINQIKMFTTLGPPIQEVRVSPHTPSKFKPKSHIFSWQGMCKLWAADNSKWVKWLEKGYQITWIYKDLKRTKISTHYWMWNKYPPCWRELHLLLPHSYWKGNC